MAAERAWTEQPMSEYLRVRRKKQQFMQGENK